MKRILLLLFLLTLAGCTKQANTDLVEKVATNLNAPWSIDFDGEYFFISEKEGAIVKVLSDWTNTTRERLSIGTNSICS